jgi:hypothetical protein
MVPAYGPWCFVRGARYPAFGAIIRKAKRSRQKYLLTLKYASIAAPAGIYARQKRSHATIGFILTEANALFVSYALTRARPEPWTGLGKQCQLTTFLKRFCRINLFTKRQAAVSLCPEVSPLYIWNLHPNY